MKHEYIEGSSARRSEIREEFRWSANRCFQIGISADLHSMDPHDVFLIALEENLLPVTREQLMELYRMRRQITDKDKEAFNKTARKLLGPSAEKMGGLRSVYQHFVQLVKERKWEIADNIEYAPHFYEQELKVIEGTPEQPEVITKQEEKENQEGETMKGVMKQNVPQELKEEIYEKYKAGMTARDIWQLMELQETITLKKVENIITWGRERDKRMAAAAEDQAQESETEAPETVPAEPEAPEEAPEEYEPLLPEREDDDRVGSGLLTEDKADEAEEIRAYGADELLAYLLIRNKLDFDQIQIQIKAELAQGIQREQALLAQIADLAELAAQEREDQKRLKAALAFLESREK